MKQPRSGQRRVPLSAVIGWNFPLVGICRSLAAAWLCAAGPVSAADPGKGGALYAVHCGSCHGARGEPVWPGAPDFRRPGLLLKPDSQMLVMLRRGRGVMPGYLGVMKDRELLDVVAFLRTLS